MRGGTYNEGLIRFSKSGASGAPIRLLNAPGERPIIDFGVTESNRITNMMLLQSSAGPCCDTPISWITIEGFEIRRGWDGIKFYSAQNVTIRRNWLHDNTGMGILGNGHNNVNVLMDRNRINHNGTFVNCGICNLEHGIYVAGRSMVVTNNLLYDNLSFGLQLNGSSIPSSDWIVANNVFANNNYRAGMVVWGNPRNVRIENNIFYENCSKNGSPCANVQGINMSAGVRNVSIKNNIFYATGSGGVLPWTSGRTVGLHYTESGNIVNTVNPGMVNPMGGDFHLNAGSPAIDKGITLPQVTWDHDGGARPFGANYDIGAYEHGSPPDSGSPPPNPTGGAGGVIGGGGGGGVTCVPVGCGADAPLPPAEFTGETTTPPGTGRNYYMSPSGNDSNPGTEAAPWRTLDRLQQAQSILRPGDTVWFRGGDYIINDSSARKSYSWSAEGTASNPIIYRNYAGETPVIVGDRRAPSYYDKDGNPVGGTMIFLQDYITIDGLNFRETAGQRLAGGHGNNPNNRNTGPSWTPISTWATGVTVRNVSIEGFGLGMYYSGRNLLFEHNRVWNTRSHRLYISGEAGTFRYNVLGGPYGYWNQQGFQVQYSKSKGNKIYGNLVYDGMATGMVFSGGVSYNEVFNNIFINPASKADNIIGGSSALAVWCEKDGGTVAVGMGNGNKFYNNTMMGYTRGSVFSDPLTPACLGVRPISKIEIYNNIFYPSKPIRLGLTQNYSNIRNNIFYNIIGAVPPGNMLINPNLANPGGTLAADAMLQAGSPAIDAAVDPGPDLDYQGGTRPVGPRKDIGAFEFGAPPGPLGGPLGVIIPPSAGCPVPGTFPPPHVIEEGVYLCPP